jgi:hypothetical protein
MLMLVVAVEEEDKLERVEPAQRAHDEVDVVELEVLADAGQALIDSGEERTLGGSDACDVRVGAEYIAM